MEISNYSKNKAKEIADLYHSAVHGISAEHYSPEQLETWAQTPPDYEFWQERLDSTHPYILTTNGRLAGFIELQEEGYIDCLYTHPDFQRKGVASALYRYVENIARDRNEKTLQVYASRSAKDFFIKQGFSVLKENTVEKKGVLLTNFYMVKNLCV